MMTPFVQCNCRQSGQVLVFACLLRVVVLACLLVAVLIGPVAAMTASQDDHPKTMTAELANSAAQASTHCDPGPLCTAFLVPVHSAPSQTTRVFSVAVQAQDSFLRPFGGPAIDLPPPRRFA